MKNALADNAPKKLIVVHLIGSHPNYSARYTDKFKLFPTQDNAQEQPVQAQLTQINASSWTKNLRDEYDNSVAYQDWVFNNIFTMLKQDKAESRGLIFLSGHGNEVGHVKDFAGHSPTTQAGYRIPVVLWHNQLALPKGANQDKAIDATQLDDNLRFMIGLQDKTNTAFVLGGQIIISFQVMLSFLIGKIYKKTQPEKPFSGCVLFQAAFLYKSSLKTIKPHVLLTNRAYSTHPPISQLHHTPANRSHVYLA